MWHYDILTCTVIYFAYLHVADSVMNVLIPNCTQWHTEFIAKKPPKNKKQ